MFRFSRIDRLVDKGDFQSVFAKPSKVSRKYLLALFRPNQKPHARLGIIISKHRVRRAVDRNRIKRAIRESFRHHKETLKGLDIIVLIRSECTPLSSQSGNLALRDDIDNLWRILITSSKPV